VRHVYSITNQKIQAPEERHIVLATKKDVAQTCRAYGAPLAVAESRRGIPASFYKTKEPGKALLL